MLLSILSRLLWHFPIMLNHQVSVELSCCKKVTTFILLHCYLNQARLNLENCKCGIQAKTQITFNEQVTNRDQEWLCWKCDLKSCVRYIFASLFFKSKRERLWNLEKCVLFHLKISFRSRENQIVEFYIYKFHDVIEFLSIKHEIHFTE